MAEEGEEVVEDAIVAEDVETIEADAEIEEVEGEEVVKAEKVAEPEDSSPPKKEGAQKRIDELTKIRRDAERDRDYWKTLAQQQDSKPEPVEPGKTLADFEYDEGEYTKYLTNQAKVDATAEVDKKITQERTARSQSEFASRESDFSSDVDDYHTVTRNNDLRITNDMVSVLQNSDDGPAALYYLGKNPEVAERLSTLSPLDMAREIGKIEATKLHVEKAPSVTKAPAPTPKISGVAKSATVKANSPDSDNLSTEDWVKRRNKQLASG